MKRLVLLLTVLAMLTGLVACSVHIDGLPNVPADETREEAESVALDTAENITVEGERVIFDDGIIRYSWAIDKWSYSLFDGAPVLHTVIDGNVVSFAILRHGVGVATDPVAYAKEGAGEFYRVNQKSLFNNLIAVETDDFFVDRGYFGDRTGYYNPDFDAKNNPAGKHLSTIHAVSDGKSTAVICIDVRGYNNQIQELHKALYADKRYNAILEGYVADILDTFAFSGEEATE